MHLAHNRAPRARLLLLDIVAPLCAIPALLAQFVDFLSRTVLTPAEKTALSQVKKSELVIYYSPVGFWGLF